jgi:hypothetical protein
MDIEKNKLIYNAFLCNETTTYLYNFVQNKYKTQNLIVKLFKEQDMFSQIINVQKKVLKNNLINNTHEKSDDIIISLNKLVISEIEAFIEYYLSKPKKRQDQQKTLHLFFKNENNYRIDLPQSDNNTLCIKSVQIKNLRNINNFCVFSTIINQIKQEYKVISKHYTIDELVDVINKLLNNNIKLIFNKILNKVCFTSKEDFEIYLDNDLAYLFGFEKTNLVNDKTYISDTDIKFDIFDNIYIQIYMDNQKIDFVTTNAKINWYSIMTNSNQDFKKVNYNSIKIPINDLQNKFQIKVYNNYFNLIENTKCIVDLILELN